MPRTRSLSSTLLLFLSLAAGVWLPSRGRAADAHRPPNILFILADDLGYSDLGCYGSEIDTPNLDRLAAAGVRFTRFYNTARCWPTRSALLSGYYPQQIRMDPPQGRLPQWTRLLPHYLRPLGYRCYHSGKWHINGAPKAVADGGFDHSYLLSDQDRFFSPKVHFEDDRPLPPVSPDSGYYAPAAIADHAVRCLREHAEKYADRPFFEYLAFTSPHFPLQALPADISKFRQRYLVGWDVIRQRRWERLRHDGLVDCELAAQDPDILPPWNLSEAELRARVGAGEANRAVPWSTLTPEQREFQATKMAIHAAMIYRMDRELGRVLAQLKTMGRLDDTLIMFASDNGASAEQMIRGDGHDPEAPAGSAKSFLGLGPGWASAANSPFRLHKSYVHEGGISTPLIVRWPGHVPAGGGLRHAVGHVIDLVPTLLDAVGAHPEPLWNGEQPPRFPGKSLTRAFSRDTEIPRDFLFWNHEGHHALRDGPWKLVSWQKGQDGWELYNLDDDRAEQHDLAAQYRGRVRRMAARWRELETQFRHEAGPPSPAPPGPQSRRRDADD